VRMPARWNYLTIKDSRQINILEQMLIAKVFNPGSGPGQAFGGICSKSYAASSAPSSGTLPQRISTTASS
jgi:hypothetical protein